MFLFGSLGIFIDIENRVDKQNETKRYRGAFDFVGRMVSFLVFNAAFGRSHLLLTHFHFKV